MYSSPSVSFLNGCGFRGLGLDIKNIHICEKQWVCLVGWFLFFGFFFFFFCLLWVGEGNSKRNAEVRGGNSTLSSKSGPGLA
jgi:hypothetical protein